MITIVSDNQVSHCGEVLCERLTALGAEAVHLVIADDGIKPCYGCGGCETKSFMRCVFRDDADRILPFIARADTLAIVTPLIYGGYSYQAKLIVDKLALLGDVHYYVKNKELVKGTDPGKYFVIGIANDCGEAEAKAFEYLVHETHVITGWQGKAIISPQACDANFIAKEVMGS